MPFLFGSAPKVQNVPITLQSQLDPTQQTAESELISALQPTASGIFPPYGQPLTAPASPLQNQAFTGLAALPGQVSGTQNQGMSTLNQILTAGPQSLTGYYNTNVLQPLQQTFEQTTLPDIMSASGGSAGGYQSTSQSNAIDQATNNFMNTLAATQGQLAYQTAQQNTANQLTASGLVPGVTGAPGATLASILSGGGTQQALAQNPLTAAYQQYLQQQQFTQTGLGDLLALLGISTQTAANQPVVVPGTPGLLPNLLGGLAGNAGLGSAIGSSLFGSGAAGAAGAGAAAGGTDFLSSLGLLAAL